MELNKHLRRYLGNAPGFKGVFHRIDTARRERDAAIAERDAALARVFQTPFFVPPGHFYSPIVDPKKAAEYFREMASRPVPDALPGIALGRSDMRLLWQTLQPYLLSCPFTEQFKSGLRYYYENAAYSYGDALVLHAMLRKYNPKRVVEIGSGWSSACMLDTVELFLNGHCNLTFIEPYPKLLESLIGTGGEHVKILAHDVQRTPLSVFEELEQNDILFIDSTHVMSTGSDVCFELFEILPHLKSGVVVHFHDVFWPFEYPRYWVVEENRCWNELYGIRAFLTKNEQWTILFFNDYFARFEVETITETCQLFLKNPGGALWLRKN
jgi:predicted O-methyltransferase YrrM